MNMNEKSEAAEDKTYIYESPDKGETIYRREFGAPHSERELLKKKEENKSTLVIEWTADDVKQVRSDLSFSDACAVINHISSHYDGNTGISWLTLKETAAALFPQKSFDTKSVESTPKDNFIFWNE